MTDWTDIAKRMATHPEWVWQKLMLVRDIGPTSEGRREFRVAVPPAMPKKDVIPVLTDDATIGLVWGMMRREARRRFGDTQPKIFFGWLERLGDVMSLEDPSQALGELWLELVG